MGLSDKRFSTLDITRTALLLAAALILSWVESVLPFQIPVPGVKLGLANIVTLFFFFLFSFPVALLFGLLRALLSSLFLGRLSGLAFSLCGTVLSVCGMALLKKCRCFSSLGVSAAGAVLHGVGQLAAASFLLTPGVWMTLPLMGLSSVFCGVITWIPLRILTRYSGVLRTKKYKNLKKE